LLLALTALWISLCCSLVMAAQPAAHNWLAAHRNWRVGVVLQAPYAQLNPRSHLLEGADVEVMVLLAGKMDVSLSWRTFSNQQALDRAVENGEVDISPGMLQTPASLHHWLFSQPYLRVPHKIVGFPDGSGNAVDLDRLSLSERLALDANSDALRFVRRNYPELPRVEVASDRAALQTVQQQYAEYAIVDEAQLATLLKEPEFSRLAVVGDLGYTHLLRIAVRRDWPELPPVLDRQLQDIPGIRMEQLYARWMLPSYPRLIDSLSFWHRTSLALLLAALLLAGLFEIGFALGMKYSEGFSKPLPTVATVVSALISLYLMSQAMKSIPVGTAYAIWTGIGAMGVAVLGIYLFNDSASPARLACVGLIVAGVIGLKLVSPN